MVDPTKTACGSSSTPSTMSGGITLEGNLQVVFDRVVRHLLDQGVRAEDAGSCMYRMEAHLGDPVLKCAVGCLILDTQYHASIERAAYDDSAVTTLLANSGIDISADRMLSMLGDLQGVHDVCNPANWQDALSALAANLGLNDKEVWA